MKKKFHLIKVDINHENIDICQYARFDVPVSQTAQGNIEKYCYDFMVDGKAYIFDGSNDYIHCGSYR
jgi:hypothetical protein